MGRTWLFATETAYRDELESLLDRGKTGRAFELVHANVNNPQLVSADTWVVMARVAYRAGKPEAAKVCHDQALLCYDYTGSHANRLRSMQRAYDTRWQRRLRKWTRTGRRLLKPRTP